MNQIMRFIALPALLACIVAADDQGFEDRFDVKSDSFISTGRSDFFILEPNHQHVYEGVEDGKSVRLVITVQPETKQIDGVETRIVEERESLGESLVEVSRNYFAIDRTTGDVYYFGEDVDEYRNGKVVGHSGGWHSGEKGARYGLFIPAKPRVGQKFYQEIAPKVAMDRAEIVSVSETVTVPAGTFENCIKIRESTPLEPGTAEHKLYARGVGLLTDGELKLVKHGPMSK